MSAASNATRTNGAGEFASIRRRIAVPEDRQVFDAVRAAFDTPWQWLRPKLAKADYRLHRAFDAWKRAMCEGGNYTQPAARRTAVCLSAAWGCARSIGSLRGKARPQMRWFGNNAWRQAAVRSSKRARNVTEAAYGAGFIDLSHFTR